MRKLKAENISKGNKEIIMDDERRKEIPSFKLVPQPLNEDAKKTAEVQMNRRGNRDTA